MKGRTESPTNRGMNSTPIVRFGFYTTSVGLLFCFPTLTIIEYKIFFFFFFCLFDILINSQADIKTHETRCLCFALYIYMCVQHLFLILRIDESNFFPASINRPKYLMFFTSIPITKSQGRLCQYI